MTRAELMRHALTQALRRVHDLAGKKMKLDEEAPMRLPKRGGRQARDQRVINVCFAPEKRILRYARGTLPSRRLTVGGKASDCETPCWQLEAPLMAGGPRTWCTKSLWAQ